MIKIYKVILKTTPPPCSVPNANEPTGAAVHLTEPLAGSWAFFIGTEQGRGGSKKITLYEILNQSHLGKVHDHTNS